MPSYPPISVKKTHFPIDIFARKIIENLSNLINYHEIFYRTGEITIINCEIFSQSQNMSPERNIVQARTTINQFRNYKLY